MTRAVESSRGADEKLAPWLMKVTVHLCADAHRERVREQRRWDRVPVHVVVPVDERVCDQAEAQWLAGGSRVCRSGRPVRCGCGRRTSLSGR
ncbi:hypothetical protein SSP24_81090 [Streptomyces spinoverrucosus]|uniref:Uncharacterized protein n=2 Tax=Streptomyces spinoverrucosus TaxID=284043 RepID=A0A4Y3VTY5_9ACTN|nr:hypothetical protein SSP24_81090 [Streptomyces spinoverrucosus]GHB91931.1 hypothetical protein GCM10010397_75540 [Streptomyces spinoverrucosus]